MLRKPNSLNNIEQAALRSDTFSHFGRFAKVRLDRNWVDYFFDDERMQSSLDDDGYSCELLDVGDSDIVHGLTWIDQMFTEEIDTVYLVSYCLSRFR